MAQFTIVLADTDERYLTLLEKRFIETCKDNAEIIIITEEEYLNTFISKPQSIDILVIQEELFNNDFEKHNIANTFILTEQKVSADDSLPKRLYKYTNIIEIFNDILNESALKNFHGIKGSEYTKSVLVYSPIGGIGKTFSAIGLSVALAKAHKRVLFLSVEPLQSFTFFLSAAKYMDTDLLNRLNVQNSHIYNNLNTSIDKDIFDYLLPFPQAALAFGVKSEKYQHYMQIVKESHEYDFIIIDSSSDFTADKSALMAFCDKTLLLLGQHPLDVHKFERFLTNIDYSNTNKFLFICNKYDGKAKDHILNSPIRTQITICDYIPKLIIDQSDLNIAWFNKFNYYEKLAYMLL
ncbi:MAG: AAA family ATPase [Firmicutes bacterium]|nr:AAA family ATPase [Bacillota bacterium]